MNLFSLFRPKPIRPFVAKIVEMLDAGDYRARNNHGWDYQFALKDNLPVTVLTWPSGKLLAVLINGRTINLTFFEKRAVCVVTDSIRVKQKVKLKGASDDAQAAAIAKIESYTVVPRS